MLFLVSHTYVTHSYAAVFPIAMNIYAEGIFNFKNMKYFQSAALMHYVMQNGKRYKTHRSYQVPTLGPVIRVENFPGYTSHGS